MEHLLDRRNEVLRIEQTLCPPSLSLEESATHFFAARIYREPQQIIGDGRRAGASHLISSGLTTELAGARIGTSNIMDETGFSVTIYQQRGISPP